MKYEITQTDEKGCEITTTIEADKLDMTVHEGCLKIQTDGKWGAFFNDWKRIVEVK